MTRQKSYSCYDQLPSCATVALPIGLTRKYDPAWTMAADAVVNDTWGITVPATVTRIMPLIIAVPTVPTVAVCNAVLAALPKTWFVTIAVASDVPVLLDVA